MNVSTLLRAGAASFGAALIVAVVAHAQAQTMPNNGTWTVQLSHRDPQKVQFGVRIEDAQGDHDSYNDDVAFSTFHGLTREQLQSPGMNVRFDVVRDAGTLHCVGYASNGGGGGTFVYAANPAFVQALSARGIAPPTGDEQIRLTLADVTIAFVDMLRRNGDPMKSASELVRLLDHGVDERYVSAMAALGYRNLGSDELVRLVDHGVRPAFAQAMQSYGYHPTPDDLVRLVDHGVTVEFVKHLRDRGYHATVEQLIRLRDSGIS